MTNNIQKKPFPPPAHQHITYEPFHLYPLPTHLHIVGESAHGPEGSKGRDKAEEGVDANGKVRGRDEIRVPFIVASNHDQSALRNAEGQSLSGRCSGLRSEKTK